jgi:hypothetical protein
MDDHIVTSFTAERQLSGSWALVENRTHCPPTGEPDTRHIVKLYTSRTYAQSDADIRNQALAVHAAAQALRREP